MADSSSYLIFDSRVRRIKHRRRMIKVAVALITAAALVILLLVMR